MSRYLKPLVVGGFLAYLGALLWQVLTNPNYLWDFRAYHVAASAQSIGLNPYDTEALRRYYNFVNMGLFEFVYPPVTLLFFKPFIWISYEASAVVFVAIKVGMIISLIYLWQRHFLKEGGVVFWLFVFFAFNQAVWIDISSGNISIIEQFCLWWAFYFWRKDRLGLFGAGVVAASLFKLVPILFLGLLLFSPNRYRWRYLVGFGGVFCTIMLGSYLIDPALFKEFIRSIGQLDERGSYNPTILSLVRDLLQVPENAALGVGQILPYGAIVGLISLISYRPLRRTLQTVEWPERSTLLIFLACFIYALAVPRFKNYSYILLIPGVYYVIWWFKAQGKPIFYWLGLAILMLPGSLVTSWVGSSLSNKSSLAYYLVNYYDLWLVLLGWGLYLYYLSSQELLKPTAPLPEPVALPELEKSL